MGRYLKIIGLLVLALALWQTSGAVFTSDGGVSTGDSTDIQAVTAAHSQDGTCFTSPQLPYLPVAELASNSGHLHSLAMSRIQRSYTAEYIFSLKDWVDKLARRFCQACSLNNQTVLFQCSHTPILILTSSLSFQ